MNILHLFSLTGGPNSSLSYSRLLPEGSYIDARDYHPRDLAQLLTQLQADPEAYARWDTCLTEWDCGTGEWKIYGFPRARFSLPCCRILRLLKGHFPRIPCTFSIWAHEILRPEK